MNAITQEIRGRMLCLSILGILTFAGTPALHASIFEKRESIHISSLHDIKDDYYCLSDKVSIDGTIEHDLSVLANDCSIQGTIGGSANIFANDLQHSGLIRQSLRSATQFLTITGRVEGSVLAAGQRLRIHQSAVIDRDLTAFGQEISVDGHVKGNVRIRGQQINISGIIDGNVDLGGDVIRIVPPAVINGDLTYTSKKEIKFDTTDVSVLGEIVWKQSEGEFEEEKEEPSSPIGAFASHLSSLLAAFLFGIIMIRLFRRYTEESLKQLQKRFSVSLAAGFVGVLVFGACIVILGVSIIAAIAGKILISSNLAALGGLLLIISTLLVPITSFSAVSGGIIYYTGSILVALLVGFPLLRLVKPDSSTVGSGTLLTGLIILSLLFAIPYLGIVLYIVATLAGAGAIILGARAARCPENNNQPANHTNRSDTQSGVDN